MKISKNYILRQVAGSWIVLPLDRSAVSFSGMLTLNETGAMLWSQLEKGATVETLMDALMEEYAVGLERGLADVNEFITKLTEIGCLEE